MSNDAAASYFEALAAIRPDLVQGRPTLHEADDDSASAGATSVNDLFWLSYAVLEGLI